MSSDDEDSDRPSGSPRDIPIGRPRLTPRGSLTGSSSAVPRWDPFEWMGPPTPGRPRAIAGSSPRSEQRGSSRGTESDVPRWDPFARPPETELRQRRSTRSRLSSTEESPGQMSLFAGETSNISPGSISVFSTRCSPGRGSGRLTMARGGLVSSGMSPRRISPGSRSRSGSGASVGSAVVAINTGGAVGYQRRGSRLSSSGSAPTCKICFTDEYLVNRRICACSGFMGNICFDCLRESIFSRRDDAEQQPLVCPDCRQTYQGVGYSYGRRDHTFPDYLRRNRNTGVIVTTLSVMFPIGFLAATESLVRFLQTRATSDISFVRWVFILIFFLFFVTTYPPLAYDYYRYWTQQQVLGIQVGDHVAIEMGEQGPDAGEQVALDLESSDSEYDTRL